MEPIEKWFVFAGTTVLVGLIVLIYWGLTTDRDDRLDCIRRGGVSLDGGCFKGCVPL